MPRAKCWTYKTPSKLFAATFTAIAPHLNAISQLLIVAHWSDQLLTFYIKMSTLPIAAMLALCKELSNLSPLLLASANIAYKSHQTHICVCVFVCVSLSTFYPPPPQNISELVTPTLSLPSHPPTFNIIHLFSCRVRTGL